MSQQPPQPPTGWATPAPGAPAQYPPPYQQGVWATPGSPSTHPYSPAPRSGGRLAIWLSAAALLVAVVALVLALVTFLRPVDFGAFVPPEGDGGGTVPGAVVGQTLSGDRIGYAVVDALLEMGADVDPGAVECETLLRLDSGSTADCTGTVDGDDSWSGWVEFTDSPGEFILYED